MADKTVTLADFREAMTALGYRVRVRRYADFAKAVVLREQTPINTGNVLTPAHLEEHAAYYTYARTHSVRDGGMVIVI